MLKHVAKRIAESMRSIDIVTRYGGEEFVILLPITTLESAVKIAESIRINVEEHPYKMADQLIKITVSIGIAEYTIAREIATFYELIDKADQALYVAKESGRNQLRVCDRAGNFTEHII